MQYYPACAADAHALARAARASGLPLRPVVLYPHVCKERRTARKFFLCSEAEAAEERSSAPGGARRRSGACPLSYPYSCDCAARWMVRTARVRDASTATQGTTGLPSLPAPREAAAATAAAAAGKLSQLHSMHRKQMRSIARLALRLAREAIARSDGTQLPLLVRFALAGAVVRWLGLFGCLAGADAGTAVRAIIALERHRARASRPG